MFQTNVQCKKCKSWNCIPLPDEDGFTSCVYCGGIPDSTTTPPEPINYRELYGHLFAEDYVDSSEWNQEVK